MSSRSLVLRLTNASNMFALYDLLVRRSVTENAKISTTFIFMIEKQSTTFCPSFMIHIINSLGMGGAENFLKDVVRPTDTVVTLLKRRCELQVNCSVVALDFLKSPFATISTLRKLVSGRAVVGARCRLALPKYANHPVSDRLFCLYMLDSEDL